MTAASAVNQLAKFRPRGGPSESGGADAGLFRVFLA